MGKEALMACTVAVEEAIEEHYTDQIKTLEQIEGHEELVDKIKQFRAEELEHRDHGIEHGAENAIGYELLYKLIQGISKSAIFISKRI
jgi:ubiquinone biosynthesis monooxygenase Coq7